MTKKRNDADAGSTTFSILNRGGIVIIPCDTIYGIVGRCRDTEEKIRVCKGREEKPFIRLIPGVDAVYEYTAKPPSDAILALWPGPLTVVVQEKGGGSVALRVPDDPFLVGLLDRLKDHLFSTSVNRAGEPALWKINDIIMAFEGRVDLILDAGDLPGRKPSTIIDVSVKPNRIVRQGACFVSPDLLG